MLHFGELLGTLTVFLFAWLKHEGGLQLLSQKCQTNFGLIQKKEFKDLGYQHITVGLLFKMAQKIKNLPAMKRHKFNPCVEKTPWRRGWQLTPVFCLENSMDREAWLSMGWQRVRHNCMTNTSTLRGFRDTPFVTVRNIFVKKAMITPKELCAHSVGRNLQWKPW